MTPKDVLGIIVRVFGLLFMGYALYFLYYALLEALGYAPAAKYPVSVHLVFGVAHFTFALVIIRFADNIVNFCYGSRKQ